MDDLKLLNIWREGNQRNKVSIDANKLLTELTENLSEFDAKLKKRDSLEITVALIMIPIAILLAYFVDSSLQQLGFGLIVPYCALVIYKLKRVKKYKVQIDAQQSQKAFLTQSKEYLVKEMNLLKTVLYWYILPAFLCASLINLGSDSGQLELILTFIGMIALFGYIYYLNRKALKDDFEPILAQLNQTIEELNN
ncbi:hypothetical protein ACFCT7_02995 [Fulvivirgaceae bacterium LMO-SS25]